MLTCFLFFDSYHTTAIMATSVFLTLQFLSLSFWVGGSFILLVVVAPSVFRHSPDKNLAGYILSPIFRRFGSLFIFNALFLTSTLYLQMLALGDGVNFKLKLALSLTSFAVFVAVYGRLILHTHIEYLRNQMAEESSDSTRQEEIRSQFFRLHGRSMVLFGMNFLVGVLVIAILIFPL
ncbi:MAG: DUF4149 domain-containing protein [Ignavibacteriales bacterium]|nr:DUF4149 domain-containing protein [Ignavibacteriales bacterium]